MWGEILAQLLAKLSHATKVKVDQTRLGWENNYHKNETDLHLK